VRWFRFAVVAVLGVMVQMTLVRVLAVRGARPDLVVALVVVFAMGTRPAGGFAVGCVLGLMRDLLSSEPLGLGTGALALLGAAVSWQRPASLHGHGLARAGLALVASVVMSGASLAVLAAQGAALVPATTAEQVAISAVGSAVLAWAVGALVWRHSAWFGLRGRAGFANV